MADRNKEHYFEQLSSLLEDYNHDLNTLMIEIKKCDSHKVAADSGNKQQVSESIKRKHKLEKKLRDRIEKSKHYFEVLSK
jgi:tRNA(Met) C34 N-acetyltransferase TmcA